MEVHGHVCLLFIYGYMNFLANPFVYMELCPLYFSAEVYVVVCFILRIQILCVQLGFLLLACFWKFDFPPMLVLVIAILNDGKK
jgi:hypothetical protein